MKRTILLLSGGIDSMVCLALLKRAGHAIELLHVNYGQAAREAEAIASSKIAQQFSLPIRNIELNLQQSFGDGEVPFRNAVLVFAAAMAMKGDLNSIAIGIHGGVPYADCSKSFVDAINSALRSSSDRNPTLIAPLLSWQKHEVIAFASSNQLPIELTYSCEAGTIPPCGRCRSCLDRKDLPC